jgi:hypothetical protein
MDIENSLEDELHKDCSHCKFLKDVGITLLDAKWLDPACHKGCSSLILKDEIKKLKNIIMELDHRIHSSYDWNADPDNMTLITGEVLLSIDK